MTFADISEMLDISLEEATRLYQLRHGVYEVFAISDDGTLHSKHVFACYEADALLIAQEWATIHSFIASDRAVLIQRQLILVPKKEALNHDT